MIGPGGGDDRCPIGEGAKRPSGGGCETGRGLQPCNPTALLEEKMSYCCCCCCCCSCCLFIFVCLFVCLFLLVKISVE